MLSDQELQTLRNMGNECEAAADEIERLRGMIKAHVDASNNDGSAGDTFGALMPGEEWHETLHG